MLSEEGSPEYSCVVKGYLNQTATQKIFDQLKAWPGTSKSATWKLFLLGSEIDPKASEEMGIGHWVYTMLSSIKLEWTEKGDPNTVARNKE